MKSIVKNNLGQSCINGPPYGNGGFSHEKSDGLEQMRPEKILSDYKNILGLSYWHVYTTFAMGRKAI